MSDRRTLSITITADARPSIKAIARVEMMLWVKRPDPNPMPMFRLFRWLP